MPPRRDVSAQGTVTESCSPPLISRAIARIAHQITEKTEARAGPRRGACPADFTGAAVRTGTLDPTSPRRPALAPHLGTGAHDAVTGRGRRPVRGALR